LRGLVRTIANRAEDRAASDGAKSGHSSSRLDARLVPNAGIPKDAHTVAAGSAKKRLRHKKPKPLYVIYE